MHRRYGGAFFSKEIARFKRRSTSLISLACDACPNDPANDADGDGICGKCKDLPQLRSGALQTCDANREIENLPGLHLAPQWQSQS